MVSMVIFPSPLDLRAARGPNRRTAVSNSRRTRGARDGALGCGECGLMVKVTSTISSGSARSQRRRRRSCMPSVHSLSEVLAPRTPPQPGQSTFHDSSNNPTRAACRKAAMTCSGSRLLRWAKASALIQHSSRSAPRVPGVYRRNARGRRQIGAGRRITLPIQS